MIEKIKEYNRNSIWLNKNCNGIGEKSLLEKKRASKINQFNNKNVLMDKMNTSGSNFTKIDLL